MDERSGASAKRQRLLESEADAQVNPFSYDSAFDPARSEQMTDDFKG
jgi:hypothetical protein